MTERELATLFAEAKDLPEFGGGFDVDANARVWNRFALDIGEDPTVAPVAYRPVEYMQYAARVFGVGFRQTAAYGLSVLTLMLGGWVASVNASFDSVPGDTLYPVKLATEKMQITLATSTERRAKLHAEFAGRRLQEVAEISVSDRTDKTARVKEAVASFKKELASAGEQLAELSSQGNAPESVALAAVLEQKTDEYQSLLVQSETNVEEAAREDVSSAKEDAQRTGAQAIDTLVSAHEDGDTEPPRAALEQSFGKDFQDVRNRISLSLGRLVTIEGVLPSLVGQDKTSYRTRIYDARAVLVGHDHALGESQDFAAAGGFRKAYELLRSVSSDVSASESLIAQLEIDITTAAHAGDVPDVDADPLITTEPVISTGQEEEEPSSDTKPQASTF